MSLTASSCLLVRLQASEQGRPPEHTSKFYAKGALQYLVPILTQTLAKQVPPRRPSARARCESAR